MPIFIYYKPWSVSIIRIVYYLIIIKNRARRLNIKIKRGIKTSMRNGIKTKARYF